MEEEGDAGYESFYEGEYSSLNPYYGNFIGYRISAENLGAPTSIQTANQVNQVVERIREGIRTVEVGTPSPEVFEQIPKQQFKEIQALAKLTGVRPSMHSPIIDPVGFGQRGWEGELAREDAEKKLFEVVEKSHDLDPEGHVPVTIHSSGGIPGTEWRPEKGVEPGEKGRFKAQKIVLINQDTREMIPVEEKREYHPLRMEKEEWKEGKLVSAEDYAKSVNATDWENKLTNLAHWQKQVGEINRGIFEEISINPELNELAQKQSLSEEEYKKIQGVMPKLRRGELFLENNRLTFKGLFDKAYKYGTEEQKKELRKLSEEWQKEYKKEIENWKKIEEQKEHVNPIKWYNKQSELFERYSTGFQTITEENPLTGTKPPEVFKPVEEFAIDKAAETFGNVAFKSYDKFGKSAPIISIENFFPGAAFSRAEDMAKLVEESQKQFVKKAMEKGMSKGAAKKEAEKLIGVTWDVGHLNMMRKAGFTEKDIIEETKKIAPLVKHVHLTDNFGYSDSHLPPGMGNVPIKEIMEKLKKAGFKGRHIVEAGAFPQHFKKSPHPFALSAFGSPIYGVKMAPYWHQVSGLMGNYFSFPMAYMPEKHFSTYGSGFSSLPEELGGQIPGTQARFGGTPTA